MKRLCSICARGGSKGVLNKNIKVIAGLPLIAHSIKQAIDSKMFSAVAVSSDSDEILNTATQFGADLAIKRPVDLATDSAAKLPAIQHCFNKAESHFNQHFDTLVDLDCTSPLRSLDDIKNSIQMFESSSADNLITAMPARRSPYFNMVKKKPDGFVEILAPTPDGLIRRQDAPAAYDLNASIYIWNRSAILKAEKVIGPKTILFEMPEERSIDIDSQMDFEWVEFLLKKNQKG